MGLFEIFRAIFEIIITFIGGLFITDSVVFQTPVIKTNNAATLTRINSNSYTVNKSDTEVKIPFTVNGYKSFKWATTSNSTGKLGTDSKCVKVTENGQNFLNNTLKVRSSDKYARQARVIAYENENCTGTSKEYYSAKIAYAAKTTTNKLCSSTKSDAVYSMVCDKSGGRYKNIGTQGHSTNTCNCYTKAYALAMLGKGIYNPNVSNALNCWESKWAGDYYVLDDRTFLQSTSEIFGIARDALKDDGRPVMVLVGNASGKTHYLLVTGIKTSSLGKKSSELTYGDFWVIDPVGTSSTPTTKEAPKERNWQTLISNSGGNSGNRRLKKGSNSAYEVTQMQK